MRDLLYQQSHNIYIDAATKQCIYWTKVMLKESNTARG